VTDVDLYDDDNEATPLLTYERENGGVIDHELRRELRRRAQARARARRNPPNGRVRGA